MPWKVLPRLAVIALALGAAALALDLGGQDDRASEKLGEKVLDGQTFSADVLRQAAEAAEPAPGACHPRRMRAALAMRAQLADLAISTREVEQGDAGILALEALSRRVLACMPTDSYAWLTLAWSLSRQQGWNVAAVAALRQSYATGPREPWVGVRRLRHAVLAHGELPEDLQQAAVAEFRSVLALSLWSYSADIVALAKNNLRARLMQEAAQVPAADRIKLAFALRALNLPTRDLGLPEQPARAWRRD